MFAEIWASVGISGWLANLIEAFILIGFLKELVDILSELREK